MYLRRQIVKVVLFLLLNLSRHSLKGEDGTPPLSSPPEPVLYAQFDGFICQYLPNRTFWQDKTPDATLKNVTLRF